MPAPAERAQAIKEGRTKYFTGKPCKNGHIDERRTKDSNCVKCYKLYAREYYHKNKNTERERKKILQRQYRTAEDYCKRAAEYARKWRLDPANKGRVLESQRLSKYGISKEDFALLLVNCDNKCEGCHHPFETKRPRGAVIDHDHATNKFRGLLCDYCNRTLGLLKDDVQTLRRLADYLEKSR